MLLTELAEELTTYLNSAPENWQAEEPWHVVTTQLDPLQCIKSSLGVYIVPGVVDYDIEGSPGRRHLIGVKRVNFISLIVSQKFISLPSGPGVTLWEEGKRILDIRQNAEEYIMSYPDAKLLGVDAEPLNELELDNRNFVAFTTFQYEGSGCL